MMLMRLTHIEKRLERLMAPRRRRLARVLPRKHKLRKRKAARS
jgi:hypothetical protein